MIMYTLNAVNTEGIADEIDTAVKISKAKKIIRKLLEFIYGLGNFRGGLFDKAEEFSKE